MLPSVAVSCSQATSLRRRRRAVWVARRPRLGSGRCMSASKSERLTTAWQDTTLRDNCSQPRTIFTRSAASRSSSWPCECCPVSRSVLPQAVPPPIYRRAFRLQGVCTYGEIRGPLRLKRRATSVLQRHYSRGTDRGTVEHSHDQGLQEAPDLTPLAGTSHRSAWNICKVTSSAS